MPRIAAALCALLTAVVCIGFNTVRYPVVWDMAAAGVGSIKPEAAEESEAAPPSVLASLSSPVSQPSSTTQSDLMAKPPESDLAAWDPPATTARDRNVAEPIPLYSAGETPAPGWTKDAPIATGDDTSTNLREPDAGREDTWSRPPDPLEDSAGGYAAEPDVAEPRAEKPVEAPPAAKYASGPWEQPASPGLPPEEGPEAAESDNRQSKPALVPVKPATTADTGPRWNEADAPSARSAVAEPAGAARTAAGLDSGPVRRLPPADQVFALPAGEKWPPRGGGSVPIYPTTNAP